MDGCRVFARLLVRAIAGEPKEKLLAPPPDTTGLDPAVAAVAAITGQLAGAIWGCSGIPEDWRTYLAWSTQIRDLAAALFEAGHQPGQAASGNRTLFDRLCGESRINVVRSPLFDQQPPSYRMPVAAERVRGMLLGLAIGDALGNTSESLPPEERRRRYGEIRDYLPNRYAGGRPVGLPSDDTQLAFWTLEHLLDRGRLDVHELARRFSERRIFGIGQSVRTFLRNYKAGQEWPEAAARSAGNGALMRIAPVLVPHLRSPSADLWVDTALCAAITHNDPASIAACVAFVGMLWQLLGMRAAPTPEWWMETYVGYAQPLEGDTRYRPRGGAYLESFEGPLWRFVAERLPQALTAGKSAREAADEWHSGAYLLETVPTVLHILAMHADDPEEAMVRAVNDTCDNDTIAAIVGAAVGALHGEAALPRRWRENLLSRTAEADDGRVFALLSATDALF
jgi:ADP-ribosyl-[dinitrogen reductase] hydrolase